VILRCLFINFIIQLFVMKRKFIFVSLTLLALIIFQISSFRLQSHVVRPLTGGLANDPGQSNCAACHSAYGAPIPRNSQFILRIALDSAGLSNDSNIITPTHSFYTPHHTQWVSIDLTGANTNAFPDSPFYGFQLTALKASPNDSMAGSFTLVDPYTSMQHTAYNGTPFNHGPVSYVSHYNPNQLHSIHTWYFLWTAPDSSAGPVTFYYSGNLGNGNIGGDPSNDYPNSDTIFAGSATVYPSSGSTVGIANIAGNIHSVSVYPVPFSDQLTANLYLNNSSAVSLSLLSLEGQTIKELYYGNTPQGHFSRSFDIAGIAPGIYFVRILSGTDSKVIKVLKY
jgi:hypothetical protein